MFGFHHPSKSKSQCRAVLGCVSESSIACCLKEPLRFALVKFFFHGHRFTSSGAYAFMRCPNPGSLVQLRIHVALACHCGPDLTLTCCYPVMGAVMAKFLGCACCIPAVNYCNWQPYLLWAPQVANVAARSAERPGAGLLIANLDLGLPPSATARS